MARSQDIAAAVALKYLGKKVVFHPRGALVEAVATDSPAAKAGLEPTDIIVAIDGKPRPNDCRRAPADEAAQAGRSRPGWPPGGQGARHEGRRNDALHRRSAGLRLQARDLRDPRQDRNPDRPAVPGEDRPGRSAARGPGRLAFALDVVEELGHDITRGVQGRRDRRDSTSTARSARSAASSRKRSEWTVRTWTSSLCLLGITPKRPASTQDRSRSSLWRVFDRRCTLWQRCRRRQKK